MSISRITPVFRQSFRSMTTQSTNQSKYWLLHYDYVAEMLDRRVPHRPAHLQYATKAAEEGKLMLGGAHPPASQTEKHPASGTLVLHCDEQEAEKFATNDPYVTNGLVMNWKLTEWAVVVGSAMK